MQYSFNFNMRAITGFLLINEGFVDPWVPIFGHHFLPSGSGTMNPTSRVCVVLQQGLRGAAGYAGLSRIWTTMHGHELHKEPATTMNNSIN